MAKQIDYPRSSFKRCIQLAKALEDIGGQATVETVADKMHKKVGGSFNATVASAVKFGLVRKEKGQIKTTDLLSNILLAYSEEEEAKFRREAFLKPPLFLELFKRFENRKLPTDVLSKILVREYDVHANAAERISGYFLDGAKTVGLLGPDMMLSGFEDSEIGTAEGEEESDEADTSHSEPTGPAKGEERWQGSRRLEKTNSDFTVHVTGPDMDSVFVVRDNDDLEIVQIILNKVRKKLEAINEADNS